MMKKLSFGSVQAGVHAETDGRPLEPAGTFELLVLGDFSGRANRGLHEVGSTLASRRPLKIDRDNFDDVFARLNVQLAGTIVDSQNEPVSIPFRELDDFHPDRLFAQLDLFSSLRQTRRQLLKNSTFEQAAEEVRSWGMVSETEEPAAPPAPQTTAEPEAEEAENLLDGILQEADDSSFLPSTTDWNAFIRDIVDPYVVPGADPQQGELVACVDAVTGRSMQAILHHRAFQQLEAAWRCLFLLIRRLETDTTLKIAIVDLSKQELAADLKADDDLTSTGLYKLLVEQTVGTPGGHPWSIVVGNYVFDDSPSDVELLGRMAKISRLAGAPFIAAADGSVVGCPAPEDTPDVDDWSSFDDASETQTWNSLCDLPEADSLGLVWPRFLLRLPYGKKTNPTEDFQFEEMPEHSSHGDYSWGNGLWGNGAFCCACLLGQSFTESGWNLHPGEIDELPEMPVHVYDDEEGESCIHPCGELLISEKGVEKIMARGVMPLLSVKEQDVLRMGNFHSLAGKPLAGRWK